MVKFGVGAERFSKLSPDMKKFYIGSRDNNRRMPSYIRNWMENNQ